MSFENSIKAWGEKALQQANTSMIKAIATLATDSVNLTKPEVLYLGGYSNGDIANNWHLSVGLPASLVPNGPDASGSASLSRIRDFLNSKDFYKKDNTVYLTNVMNYSYRANALGWPAGQGTNGWTWKNNIKVGTGYGFVGKAINNLKGKYM